MIRWRMLVVIGMVFSAGVLPAQEAIQQGKVKKLDAEKTIITLTVQGKDQDYLVTADTRVMDGAGQEVRNLFQGKSFAPGTQVIFKAGKQDGKNILVGLKIAGEGEKPGAGDIQRAKIRKIHLEKMLITLTVAGKDRDFLVLESTQIFDAKGKDLKERLQGFKEGTEVFFKATRKDGHDTLVGLKRVESAPARPKVDTSKLVPLTEMGAKEYEGFKGGLYPGGKNERPSAHEGAGLRRAKLVQPLDAQGKPSPEGRIVLLSIGMSNTGQASMGFQRVLEGDKDKNPRVMFVNGAQGGMTAAAIQDPEDQGRGTKYWTTVDQRLQMAGVTRDQVQVVWIKQADAGPSQGFPGYARKLQEELVRIVQVLPRRFPNVQLTYLSSRTFGGYAKTSLNPEPYAFESGLAVRWLIEQQLKGDPVLSFETAKGPARAPWLSWGPYLWANGTTKRADGFSYQESDFSNDGTHLSPSGMEKVGGLMLQFFKNDSTTRPWFVR